MDNLPELAESKKDWKYSISLSPANYRYNFMDIFKFICALLIIFIHIRVFPSGESKIIKLFNFAVPNIIARIAVPFYFTAAGFLLFRKIETDNPSIKTVAAYLVKNLKIFALWIIILFLGGHIHLWYIKALIVAVGIIFLLLKVGLKPKTIFIISILLYIIGLLGDSYYGLINNISFLNTIYAYYVKIFVTTRNGIFMGMSFVSMGLIFAKCNISFSKLACCLGLIVSFILMAAEAIILQLYHIPKDYNMYVFLQPVTFFGFYFITHIQLKDNPIYEKLRNMGILIYLSHMFWKQIIYLCFRLVQKAFSLELSPYIQLPTIFILTVALTILFAIIIVKISEKNKAVKWFYS